MTAHTPVEAMDAALPGLSAETQSELNIAFHKAKWDCFFNAFPMTEPLERTFFLFGADADPMLVCIFGFCAENITELTYYYNQIFKIN